MVLHSRGCGRVARRRFKRIGPPGRAFGSREAPFLCSLSGVPGGRRSGNPRFFHHLPGLLATPFGLVEGPYPESPPDVRFENHFSL